jgi:hypothetical protein
VTEFGSGKCLSDWEEEIFHVWEVIKELASQKFRRASFKTICISFRLIHRLMGREVGGTALSDAPVTIYESVLRKIQQT